jgi:hypothetical protein
MNLYLVVRVEELCSDSEAQPFDCLPGVEASRLRLDGLAMQFDTVEMLFITVPTEVVTSKELYLRLFVHCTYAVSIEVLLYYAQYRVP